MELLVGVRNGDAQSLDRLLARHLPPLKRWASGRLPNWARDLCETQDIVQESVVRALKHLERFQPTAQGGLRAYFRKAIANRICDEIRRAQRRGVQDELTERIEARTPSPLEEAIGREVVERYERALAGLKPQERAAIVARLEQNQSYQQIAERLGKPTVAAARVAVGRALARLEAGMKNGPEAVPAAERHPQTAR
ncbi:MAG TPA: sigma-70 family RNA polymerase sigma factor [Vicinamibacterales bacterium]